MLKKNRREEILKAAITIFAQKGYHDTSISDIIERAGIARGTFYLYFENKRQIFDSILENLMLELDRSIKKILIGPGYPDPLQQLKANLERVLTLLIDNPEVSAILLKRAPGLDIESDQKITEFYRNMATMIDHAIGEGIKMGLIRECDPTIVAYCIVGSIKEVVEYILSLEDKKVPSIEHIVNELLFFGLSGIRNRNVI